MGAAKLKKLMLRYYPPGIILQYEISGFMKQKPIDLLDLSPDTDLEVGCHHGMYRRAAIKQQCRPCMTCCVAQAGDGDTYHQSRASHG